MIKQSMVRSLEVDVSWPYTVSAVRCQFRLHWLDACQLVPKASAPKQSNDVMMAMSLVSVGTHGTCGGMLCSKYGVWPLVHKVEFSVEFAQISRSHNIRQSYTLERGIWEIILNDLVRGQFVLYACWSSTFLWRL